MNPLGHRPLQRGCLTSLMTDADALIGVRTDAGGEPESSSRTSLSTLSPRQPLAFSDGLGRPARMGHVWRRGGRLHSPHQAERQPDVSAMSTLSIRSPGKGSGSCPISTKRGRMVGDLVQVLCSGTVKTETTCCRSTALVLSVEPAKSSCRCSHRARPVWLRGPRSPRSSPVDDRLPPGESAAPQDAVASRGVHVCGGLLARWGVLCSAAQLVPDMGREGVLQQPPAIDRAHRRWLALQVFRVSVKPLCGFMDLLRPKPDRALRSLLTRTRRAPMVMGPSNALTEVSIGDDTDLGPLILSSPRHLQSSVVTPQRTDAATCACWVGSESGCPPRFVLIDPNNTASRWRPSSVGTRGRPAGLCADDLHECKRRGLTQSRGLR